MNARLRSAKVEWTRLSIPRLANLSASESVAKLRAVLVSAFGSDRPKPRAVQKWIAAKIKQHDLDGVDTSNILCEQRGSRAR